MAMIRLDEKSARVVIVGAGIAGISMAIALKRDLGFDNFVIYERANDLGGTWRDNVYPGCGSDVGGHWYSLSTELNPDWTSFFVDQPEILRYWRNLAVKHGLIPHIVFNTTVVSAEWDDETQIYDVKLKESKGVAGDDSADGKEKESGWVGGREGREWTQKAEVLVSAIGAYRKLGWPKEIFGEKYDQQETFEGEVFHAGKWRYDVPLSGKRVGVVGNGCSVAQFLPEIAKDPSTQVVNICRTPSWFLPRVGPPYSKLTKWMFKRIPYTLRSYRNTIMLQAELASSVFFKDNQWIRGFATRTLTKYITDRAPPEYLDQLVPKYPVGCKRVVGDPGYFKALNQPNVSMSWDGIEKLEKEGVRTKKGDLIPLDVIILGTGFAFGDVNIAVKGSKGTWLQDYFKSKGGNTAYLGTCIPGFPNFFMLLGPNTATGHASIVFSEECQINYSLKLIEPVIRRSARSFEVKEAACDAYDAKVQDRLSSMVWTECLSYYRGSDGKGKNTATFPGPMVLLWWWMRKVQWGDFTAVGAERWKSQMTWKRRRTIAMIWLGVLMMGAFGVLNKVKPGQLPLPLNVNGTATGLLKDAWSRASDGVASLGLGSIGSIVSSRS